MTVDSGYADFFGPQVPRTGDEAQTATFALASAAYRDNPVEEILKANNEWHESAVKGGRSWAKIFRPNLGEAFSTAVITRMLGKGRKPSSSPSAPSRRSWSSTASRRTTSAGTGTTG